MKRSERASITGSALTAAFIHTERVRDELVVYTMTLAGLQVDEVADTVFRLPNNVLATEVE